MFTKKKLRAATAKPTSGPIGIAIYSGIDVEFEAQDQSGSMVSVLARGFIGVKSADTGSNLLGMQEISAVGGTVIWPCNNGCPIHV